jgi:glucose/arabinose dehydrogenase
MPKIQSSNAQSSREPKTLMRSCAAAGRAAGFLLAIAWSLPAANAPACDPDNGGLQLPQGFCALVVADGIGPARHIAAAPNGDIYVALQANGRKGGVVALRDTNGDGRFETKEKIGQDSITGVALRNGYLYVAKFHSVERYKMPPGQLTPSSPPELVVSGLPGVEEHGDKNGAFIAFHGSWNRAPMPQEGYNVTFQPFVDEKPSGDFEVFASGFAGATPLMNPDKAVARADGVAEAPDGSLFISESQKGKIWRVIYRGEK